LHYEIVDIRIKIHSNSSLGHEADPGAYHKSSDRRHQLLSL